MTNRHDMNEPSEDEAERLSDLSRREALGRLGLYTSPLMLALLMSERAVAVTFVPG